MKKKKILIVDDEISIRLTMAFALKSEGYIIDFAKNGVEALSCIERLDYDLIITDYLMPYMDGLALIKKIKSKWPTIPIILVSGTFQNNDYLEKEAVICIQKPFSVSNLLDQVEVILKGNGGED